MNYQEKIKNVEKEYDNNIELVEMKKELIKLNEEINRLKTSYDINVARIMKSHGISPTLDLMNDFFVCYICRKIFIFSKHFYEENNIFCESCIESAQRTRGCGGVESIDYLEMIENLEENKYWSTYTGEILASTTENS